MHLDLAKNAVQEIFQALGVQLIPDQLLYKTHRAGNGEFVATIDHKLPDETTLKGTGSASRRRDAEKFAALDALTNRGPQPTSWRADAQLGDALIKLAAYLHEPDPAARSTWLQKYESNAHLATMFDEWHAKTEIQGLGTGRGETFRATVVEAMIWRDLRERILTPDVRLALGQLAQTLENPA